MKSSWAALLVISIMAGCSSAETKLPENPELSMSSVEIIRFRGYPAEVHPVVTDDGYILELHRIPPRHHNRWMRAKPVFLMYGFFGTDAIWSLPPAHRSLGKNPWNFILNDENRFDFYFLPAYILADRGYDVWMGNSRGNTYSRKHLLLDPDKDEDYWEFGWDEMGQLDIPASLSYVLAVTGHERLVYIGNSFGCTLFFIAMSSRPEWNDRIDLMVAMAPVSTMAKVKSPPVRLMASLYRPFLKKLFEKVSKGRAFGDMTSSPRLRAIQRWACETSYERAALCREFLFALIGRNPDNLNLV